MLKKQVRSLDPCSSYCLAQQAQHPAGISHHHACLLQQSKLTGMWRVVVLFRSRLSTRRFLLQSGHKATLRHALGESRPQPAAYSSTCHQAGHCHSKYSIFQDSPLCEICFCACLCRQDLSDATAQMSELFKRVKDIQTKAADSEVLVQEICRDIRKVGQHNSRTCNRLLQGACANRVSTAASVQHASCHGPTRPCPPQVVLACHQAVSA